MVIVFRLLAGRNPLSFFVVQCVKNPNALYNKGVEFHQKLFCAIVKFPCHAPPPLKNHFHEKFIIEPRLLKLNELIQLRGVNKRHKFLRLYAIFRDINLKLLIINNKKI